MRTHSTPQSALNLEITKLAIIESAASVALYLWLAVYLGTFKYLAMAVVVAPLMLFRTESSAHWGLKTYEQCLHILLRKESDLYNIVALILAPVIGANIRVIATLYWVFRHPLQTLREVPQNWLRQSLCTDFFHPPEVIPLEASKGDRTRIPTFADWIETIRDESTGWKMIFLALSLPLLAIGWLPSVVYRISFKATALAYTPFLWVVRATLQNPLSVKIRLERITKGELEKVRRAFSWIVAATLAAKLAFVFGWVDRSFIEAKFESRMVVESLVFPDIWPWWQITLGADALLTFFLFYYADAALARIESNQPWRDKIVLEALSTISLLRSVLGIVIISHFFYIALVKVAPSSLLGLLAGVAA